MSQTKKSLYFLLALFAIGIILAIVFSGTSKSPVPVPKPVPYDLPETYKQWDSQTGQYLIWQFDEDRSCTRQAENGTTFHFTYEKTDTNDIRIYAENTLIWNYDTTEHCYWYSYEENGQTYKSKILPSDDSVGTSPLFYQYRTDNGTAMVAPEEQPTDSPDEQSPDPLSNIKAYIAKGDYETAYRQLTERKDASPEAAELLSRFAFVPLKITYQWDNTRIEEFQYNSNGYLLKHQRLVNQDATETNTLSLDKKGNVLSYEHKDHKYSSETYTLTYSYDEYGNKLTKVENGTNRNEWQYVYDDNGNILEEKHTNPYNLVTHSRYNADGQLLMCERLYTGHTETSSYSYDANGKLLEVVDSDLSGVRKTTYTYNQNGQLLLIRKPTRAGDINEISYTYDDRGNLIYENHDLWDDESYYISYAYDSNNNLTEQQTDDERTVYTYDSKGRKASYTYHDGLGSRTTTYSYDEYDNMVFSSYDNHNCDTSYTYQLFYYPDSIPYHIQELLTYFKS